MASSQVRKDLQVWVFAEDAIAKARHDWFLDYLTLASFGLSSYLLAGLHHLPLKYQGPGIRKRIHPTSGVNNPSGAFTVFIS